MIINWGCLLLRVGIGFVFVVFGVDKLTHPQNWLVYLPSTGIFMNWSQQFPDFFHYFLRAQGVTEFLTGICLTVGFMTRVAAVLASLILLAIVYTLGWDPIAIRDVGLFSAAVAILFFGPGLWSLDHWIGKIAKKEKGDH